MTGTGMKLSVTKAHVLFSTLVEEAGQPENDTQRTLFVEQFSTEIPRVHEFYLPAPDGDTYDYLTHTLEYVSHISPMVVKDEKGNVLVKIPQVQREVA